MLNSEAALEALVVIGVVGRVVWSLLGSESLAWEAGGLVTLATLALGLEFASWRSRLLQQLKPRPNLSSGILLGSVTLPIVLSARLVQLLRGSAVSGEISPADLERLKLEFWLALACSTSMLMMIVSFWQKRGASSWKCAAFLEYSSVAVLMLMTPGQKLSMNWIGLWAGVHILGGKGLFSYVLRVFPFSGTVGEVMIVVEGIVLCGANAAAWFLPRILSVSTGEAGDLAPGHLMSTVLQVTILGVLLIPLIYQVLYRGLQFIERRKDGKERKGFHEMFKAGLFYIVLLLMVFLAIPMCLGMVTAERINPLFWAIQFVCEKPVKRILISIYWVGVIWAPLPHLYRISVSGQVPKILVRKYYHIMIVIMFVPALLLDPEFLQLAFGVALSAFLIIEMIRAWRLPGHQIENFMKPFTDHRDSGVLIISHFSLLLGCALPVWLNSGSGDRPLASYAGILSLGIGDTMASVIGYNFGSIHVSSKSKKTLEGTVSGISSVLVSCLILTPILSLTTGPAVLNGFWSVLGASIIGGVLEAYTLQLDNAFIPLIFYTLLCL
ncbi:unnamed protein product [Calypogeia fissa]